MSSEVGALYGKLIHHRAALAGTRAAEDRIAFEPARAPLQAVAEHSRGEGKVPYRVIRDTTVHPPFGRHCVYVGGKRIGAQLSVPSAGDCQRMEFPPAPIAPLDERLDKRAQMALGLGAARATALKMDAPGERIKAADAARLQRTARPGSIRTLPGGQKVKRCAGCKETKEVAAFNSGSGPGGLHRHCRDCRKKAYRVRAAEQREPRG